MGVEQQPKGTGSGGSVPVSELLLKGRDGADSHGVATEGQSSRSCSEEEVAASRRA